MDDPPVRARRHCSTTTRILRDGINRILSYCASEFRDSTGCIYLWLEKTPRGHAPSLLARILSLRGFIPSLRRKDKTLPAHGKFLRGSIASPFAQTRFPRGPDKSSRASIVSRRVFVKSLEAKDESLRVHESFFRGSSCSCIPCRRTTGSRCRSSSQRGDRDTGRAPWSLQRKPPMLQTTISCHWEPGRAWQSTHSCHCEPQHGVAIQSGKNRLRGEGPQSCPTRSLDCHVGALPLLAMTREGVASGVEWFRWIAASLRSSQ